MGDKERVIINYLLVNTSLDESAIIILEGFIDDVKNDKEVLSLASIIPPPKFETYIQELDWSLGNWGVDSDCKDSTILDRTNASVHYGFITTAPPFEWIKNVSLLYPALGFFLKYEEDKNGGK